MLLFRWIAKRKMFSWFPPLVFAVLFDLCVPVLAQYRTINATIHSSKTGVAYPTGAN
jgi:hypothetical protein